MRKCKKCGCIIYGLGDDYCCPICENEFCYECIKTHGCNVETKSIGNKHNYIGEDFEDNFSQGEADQREQDEYFMGGR